jgi:Resolvase, N terminal domain
MASELEQHRSRDRWVTRALRVHLLREGHSEGIEGASGSSSSPVLNSRLVTAEGLRIGFKSLTEQFDTATLSGKVIFRVFGGPAEFERDLTRERTHADLAAARVKRLQSVRALLLRCQRASSETSARLASRHEPARS